MLRVNYKIKYGYMVMQTLQNKYIKVGIYQANCLFATIHRTKEEDILVNFYADMQHLKNCFKPSDSVYTKKQLKKVILFDNLPHFEKIAKVIVNAGFKVELKHK